MKSVTEVDNGADELMNWEILQGWVGISKPEVEGRGKESVMSLSYSRLKMTADDDDDDYNNN